MNSGKVPLRFCFFFLIFIVLCLSFTVQTDLCQEFDSRRMFAVSVLIESLILRDGLMCMICDITKRLGANPIPVQSATNINVM